MGVQVLQKKIKEEGLTTEKKTLNVLSLFSGGGGMDLGFEGGFTVPAESVNEKLTPTIILKRYRNGLIELRKTRFKTVFSNDIFGDAKKVWAKYFVKRGHDPRNYLTDSIVDLVKMHKSGKKVFPSNIDVVTGGFPCQDFSNSGLRKGFNSHKNHKGEIIEDISVPTVETRGMLYMWMKEVIEITRPKMFIAENVKGLVNLENVKEIIQKDFSKAGKDGYIVLSPRILHAANYGVPQSRERVFFIGIKRSALLEHLIPFLEQDDVPESLSPYPLPTHAFNIQKEDLKPPATVADYFRYVVEPSETHDESQKYYSRAAYLQKGQGQTEVKLNGIGPTIRSEHHGNIEFRRKTIEHGGRYYEELKSGLLERRLTVRECALIQTFPLDMEFVFKDSIRENRFSVSPSQAYKVIGNAVPPLLAYHIALRIQEVWEIYFGDKK